MQNQGLCVRPDPLVHPARESRQSVSFNSQIPDKSLSFLPGLHHVHSASVFTQLCLSEGLCYGPMKGPGPALSL